MIMITMITRIVWVIEQRYGFLYSVFLDQAWYNRSKQNSMGNLDKIQKVGNWFSTILLGETKELIVRIDERTSRLAEDMRDIKPKVDSMSPKVDVLWDVWKNKYAPAGSPRQLNETGQGILNSSGIKEIIDGKKDELLDIVKTHNPNNSYDAEQTILDVVANLQKHFPDVVDDLKTLSDFYEESLFLLELQGKSG